MDEYEELTEEELRRRREAARRRKMAARERRRRKRRQEAIVRCSILLIIVILLIVGIVKGISGISKHFRDNRDKKKNNTTSEQPMNPTTEIPTTEEFKVDSSILAAALPADRESALALIKERAEAEADTELQNICDNEAVYSDRVLINLAANPELKQYTIDYLTKVTTAYDGDFSMDIATDDVPLLLQYDDQWGYADYGDNLIAYNGAAPTCLAMAASYLKKDTSYNPIKVGDFAMENSYLDENSKTTWDLMTKGTGQMGLTCDEMSVNEGNMKASLDDGEVIICCMQSGDFTLDEHYIVIRGYDDYKFLVNDPASKARSEIAWPFERLSSQIKNMWAIGINLSATPEDGSSEAPLDGDQAGDGTADNGTTGGDTSTNDTGNAADGAGQ